MENYKIKYEQALSRARNEYQTHKSFNGFCEMLTHIFPELKESEDEKIRKGIIEYLEQSQFGEEHYCVDDDIVRDYVAWLEKQGEKPQGKTALEAIQEKKVDNRNFVKPIDKIEPKFKVGNWIVQGNIGVYKVIEVCESWYEVVDNKDEHYSIGFDVEYMCHLWTIQDAKEGDVLVSPATQEGDKECPFIFKKIDKIGIVRFYVALLQNKDFEISNDVSNVMGYANAGYHVPATKEQCDLLFSKMKEAGYEWDSEKKEVKKIEQQPVEWSEEDKRVKIYGIDIDAMILKYSKTREKETNGLPVNCQIRAYRQGINDALNLCLKTEKQDNMVESLRTEYEKGRADAIAEVQKHVEWSEEDEKMCQNLLYLMEENNSISSWEGCYEWLKSLKERMKGE